MQNLQIPHFHGLSLFIIWPSFSQKIWVRNALEKVVECYAKQNLFHSSVLQKNSFKVALSSKYGQNSDEKLMY